MMYYKNKQQYYNNIKTTSTPENISFASKVIVGFLIFNIILYVIFVSYMPCHVN